MANAEVEIMRSFTIRTEHQINGNVSESQSPMLINSFMSH
eukprot:SAG25_NODE_4949_length_726_cov_0.821372_1_plen_39_part_10